jgi:hypothetical protein
MSIKTNDHIADLPRSEGKLLGLRPLCQLHQHSGLLDTLGYHHSVNPHGGEKGTLLYRWSERYWDER